MPLSRAPDATAYAPVADRVDRISSVGSQDTLDRIRNSPLLDAGSVNMIGLDAIKRQLGDRWPNKRGRVWEHVERELERTLSPADLSVRVDELNYLVAQPGAPSFAAQAVCMTILQDVLKFFLGELRPADIVVRNVSAVGAGEIVSAPVDLATIRRGPTLPDPAAPDALSAHDPAQFETPAERDAAAVTGPLADHAPPPKEWKPPLAGRTSVVPLAPPKREPFDLQLRIEPVWNLRRGVISSFVIDRAGAPAKAEASDLEEMDVATFAYAATILEEHERQGGALALHVPVSFSSLATLRTRERLMRLTRPVREAMRGAMLIEICGLDAGVPPSRLIEVVGLVRSLCAGVLGRVRPSRSALDAAKGCGLRGVVVEASLLGLTQRDAAARLKAYASIAREIAPNVVIHGLPSPTMVDDAASAGFTHASVAPQPDET
jgi:hypothetical protein